MAASVVAAQTPDYILQQNSASLTSIPVLVEPSQAPFAAESSMPAAASAPVVPGFAQAKVRIGLLLPLSSPSLGEAAAVVRQGFNAALHGDARRDVGVAEAAFSDENGALEAYRSLLAQGANVVIGPLTRTGISRIAPHISVPTLALNSLEGVTVRPKLYSLSLAVDAEAKQVAGMMADNGHQRPLLVYAKDGLSQRLRQAFSSGWLQRRGSGPLQLDVDDAHGEALDAALAQADAVFLALGGREAALVRAVLPQDLPAYATSQVNVRESLPVLSGVRFVDMPWLLMPDHPVVRTYPRPERALTVSTERLYALGIDAYRLALRLSMQKNVSGLRLDGVTGDLRLGRDQQFQRTLPTWVRGELQ
ncbi:MAG: penicillin-binding protein activator [Craterilacuibacter sp.]